jgi:alkylation response protein AidB-like acyl-CoA dehydrogenase
MDFSYSEEQQLLRDSIARFIQKDYAFETRRAAIRSAEGFSRASWRTLAELGVLGLPFPEAYGGFGGTPIDTMLVMQALGNGLAVEPYLATVVLSGSAIALGGTEAQQRELLPRIAAGELLVAFAHYEPQSRYGLYDMSASAVYHGASRQFTLNGAKAVVQYGAQADKLVVSARTAADESVSLFVVDRASPGVSVRDYRTIDGLRAAEISFTNVAVPDHALLGQRDKGWDVIERVVDRGIAALCAEAVGVMETLNAQTLEYIKARQQFGQPIGRFQVLQHRAVDMMIHCEQSKSMAILAAVRAGDPVTPERRREISAAKVHIGRSGRLVAQAAIQLHGGMGVTDEMPASHYAKRLTMIDFMLGDAEYHLDRMIARSVS